jgi:hypothetical protein
LVIVGDRRDRAKTTRAALAAGVLVSATILAGQSPLKPGLDLRNIDKTIVLYARRS